jgi:RNA polymerase sigma factor (sigma-70 family)
MMSTWHWHVPDLISQDEEDKLIEQSVKGDLKARAQLVMANLRLVLHMAASLARLPHEQKDLIGEGLLGAWIAANRFDPSYGVKFCTYASWWVRSYMVLYKKRSSRLLVRSPRTYILHKELDRSYAATGLGPGDQSVRQDMTEKFDITHQRLQQMLDAPRVVHLDVPINGTEMTLADTLASDTCGPEDECARNEELRAAQQIVRTALSTLTDREAFVVRSILMEEETFSETGAKLGVSKQRAKQICDKAVVKMRRRLHSNFHAQCS